MKKKKSSFQDTYITPKVFGSRSIPILLFTLTRLLNAIPNRTNSKLTELFNNYTRIITIKF